MKKFIKSFMGGEFFTISAVILGVILVLWAMLTFVVPDSEEVVESTEVVEEVVESETVDDEMMDRYAAWWYYQNFVLWR